MYLALSLLIAFSTVLKAEITEYPAVYPFVPFEVEDIYQQVHQVTEDANTILNIHEMQRRGLDRASTAQQPWQSSFWPTNKGLIADPFDSRYNPFTFTRDLAWKQNIRRFHRRMNRRLSDWRGLRQKSLDHLAPSEKYDILLGDDNFGLTRKLWDYVEKWGEAKENSFITSSNILGGSAWDYAHELAREENISFPEALARAIELRGGLVEHLARKLVEAGEASDFQAALPSALSNARSQVGQYVLKSKNSLIATWEGICHGWSTASGIIPRPTHAVDFKIPGSDKHLRFYPDDIKALISLTWANSVIQDGRYKDDNGNDAGGGVIMAGLRCNNKNPPRDQWGRFYDATPDKYSRKLEPRCVGVHPAIWHIATVNLIGVQHRSFIVERKISEKVDNHPMARYKVSYFNPYSGNETSLSNAIVVKNNSRDQFAEFRSSATTHLVGIKLEMTYVDFGRPHREDTDGPQNDQLETVPMLYDLELDARGNIVGGQWRATEVGSIGRVRAQMTQPDFFWVIAKNWRSYFNENRTISAWRNKTTFPPADWKEAAKLSHDFVYNQTQEFGFNDKCDFINNETGEEIQAPCEHKFDRPQPLLNVVNTLLELPRRGGQTIETPRPGEVRRAERRRRRNRD